MMDSHRLSQSLPYSLDRLTLREPFSFTAHKAREPTAAFNSGGRSTTQMAQEDGPGGEPGELNPAFPLRGDTAAKPCYTANGAGVAARGERSPPGKRVRR